MTRVAIIGLGAMGLPMAERLAETFPVRGYRVAPARVAAVEASGIKVCGSAVEAVQGAEVVLIAVRNQQQLEEVLFAGEAGDADRAGDLADGARGGSAGGVGRAGGIAGDLAENAVVILTSTVGVEVAQQAAARLQALGKGVELVDAPISGGPARARAGDLLITVGAGDAAWAKAQPVLQSLSSKLVRMGDEPGRGQAMKTVNQLLCGVHIAAAGEALALAAKLGLDQRVALEALMAGAAASFMLGERGPRMIEAYEQGAEAPEVRARIDVFVKDMGIVCAAAKSAGMPAPVAAAAEQQYLHGLARGQGAMDDSSVIRVVSP